jgi:hypothetical protein
MSPEGASGGDMRHLSITVFLIAAMGTVSAEEPLYILEQPGIAFGWLTAELNPPIEGSLTEEAGAIASSPTSLGVEYHIHYWEEDMGANDRAGDWLELRLRSIISPDMQDALNIGDINWREGSMMSPYREDASLGLLVSANFNVITDSGDVLAIGKAYAVFVNGYSVLMYGISPLGVTPTPGSVLDEIVAWAYLVS